MTLGELIGNIPVAASTVGRWQDVDEWTLGANDKYGDCAFVALCNLQDLLATVKAAPFVIEEGEALYFYNVEAGFNSQDRRTDKGAVLEEVIRYWAEKGWPSDPVDKPLGWCAIRPDEIHLAIQALYGVPAWCQLPQEDDNDFSDTALDYTPGDGHAVLIVGSDPTGYTLITWAEPVHVSTAWWHKFGRGQYAIKCEGVV